MIDYQLFKKTEKLSKIFRSNLVNRNKGDCTEIEL